MSHTFLLKVLQAFSFCVLHSLLGTTLHFSSFFALHTFSSTRNHWSLHSTSEKQSKFAGFSNFTRRQLCPDNPCHSDWCVNKNSWKRIILIFSLSYLCILSYQYDCMSSHTDYRSPTVEGNAQMSDLQGLKISPPPTQCNRTIIAEQLKLLKSPSFSTSEWCSKKCICLTIDRRYKAWRALLY